MVAAVRMFKALPSAAGLALVLLTTCVFAGAARASEPAELWLALRTGEAFALMRHALAPGSGDPDNFAVADCSTQRNLDARGRAQARQVGERFRAHGIGSATVYSSPWCRCLDTATGLDLGPVRRLDSLGSIHRRPDLRDPRVAVLQAWLEAHDGGGPLVLVSHHSVIRALTGVGPASGEIIVARQRADGSVAVLGRL